jgi:hypothetical protein
MKHLLRRLVFVILAMASFNAKAILQQEADNWCWASAIQDVMAQVGMTVPQAMIVSRLRGWPANAPASSPEVAAVLRSYGMRSWDVGAPGSPMELANTLLSGFRLIAFVRPAAGPVGHFIVLQGVDPRTGIVIVSDPANGMTYPMHYSALYMQWHWGGSVVVGRGT